MNEIRLLCVSPKSQRQGIGRMLWDHIRPMAPSALFPDIFVYSSLQSASFYKACGFIEKGPYHFDFDGLLEGVLGAEKFFGSLGSDEQDAGVLADFGIVEGAASQGVKFDVWDAVLLNANQELTGYYTEWYDKQHGKKTDKKHSVAEHCSAFVATGSWTKDGRPVLAHNCWTDYAIGARWNIIFDVRPAGGHRFIMDGLPGMIHSGDDFGINGAGIMIAETTIGSFHGFDPEGIPECVRARKAMQYAASIDDFARIMKDGNNGGYANNWLLADVKNNEIASLELGLKNVTLERKKDGYIVGSNFPVNQNLIREETDFDTRDMSASANARHVRWEQLMAENKGKIDMAAAQQFLADHYDTFSKKEEASERTLDGHIDLSARGSQPWQPPFGNAGAVQNKAADAAMVAHMSFTAAAGHACGKSFKAQEYLREHPEFNWEQGLLRDMNAFPWTTFSVAK